MTATRKNFTRKTTMLMTGVAVTALCLGMSHARAQQAPALPTGGSVAAGAATISAAKNTMTINQSSQAAIINWNTFSIGNGGAVNFNNGSGATLNRVTGNVPSQLDGSLTATGSLYLINPAGVVVGTTGRIATGGSFVASTHDVSDADFLAGGAMTFKGGSQATVVNYGKIGSLGGDVALIARKVENNGTINAKNGTVALAAGYEVLMRDATLSDGKFLVKVGGSDTEAGTTGTIRAANVELKANGGSVYALAGNTQSITKATGLDTSGGKIIFSAGATGNVKVSQKLVAQRHVTTADGKRTKAGGDVRISGGDVTLDGEIDASGKKASGGTVVATGDNVTLTKNANIKASGLTGGTILIGGDRLGGSDASQKFLTETVANAKTTRVEQGARLTADGTSGNGGNIVVWSDQHTYYNGAISARGGATSGNGGFAEVSSHGLLNFLGTADLRAPNGMAGTLLLDPYDVVISSGTDAGGGLGSDPTSTSIININTLIAALANANVTVTTGGAGSAGTDAGDITVADTFSWTSGNALTLSAYRNINVNANISGGGAIVLRADNSGTGTGTVTYGSGVNVSTTSGSGVNVYYNPTNSAPGTVNGTEYTSGTQTSYSGATAWMLVNNVYDLQNMQNNRSGKYALGADIDASTTADSSWNSYGAGYGFKPVGYTYGALFNGSFDGLNHIIIGLYENAPTNSSQGVTGLFGYIGGAATIKNVGLVGGSFTGTVGFAGSLVGAALYGGATIDNVFAYNTNVTNNTTSGNPLVGGTTAAGGLIGLATVTNSSNINISRAYTSGGAVKGSGAVGGLIGLLGNLGVLTKSYSDNAVTDLGGGSYNSRGFGGLVGIAGYGNQQDVTISDSYATGEITGSTKLGGLVGSTNVASFTLSTSYATGKINYTGTVPDTSTMGGLVGYFVASRRVTVTDSYWNTTTSGFTTSAMYGGVAQGTGLDDTAMHTQGSFSGFDFTNTWAAPTLNGGVDSNGTTGLAFYPGLLGVSHVLVVTPNDQWVQQGNVANLTGKATGLQSGDTVGSLGLSTTADASSPLGSYAIDASPTLVSARAQYTPTYRVIASTANLTVMAEAPVTYVVANATSTYGQLASLGSVTLNGIAGGDQGSITGVITLYDVNNNVVTLSNTLGAGTYTVAVTGLTGTNASLYKIIPAGNTTGTLTIGKAVLTITTQATIADKVYDGNNTAAVATQATVSGVVGSDDVAMTLYLGFFAGSDAGTNKTVTGNYVMTGTTAANYSLSGTSFFTGSASITPKTLTVGTAGTIADKVYDGTTAATVATNGGLSGVIGADAVTLTLGGVSFADKNAGAAKTVNGTYSLGGGSAGNYQLASTTFTGSATINKASLTISAVSDTKTYDGSTSSSGVPTYSGLVGSDTVGGLTQAFDSPNAGARTLSVTGYTVNDGNSGGNYTVVTNTAAGTINPGQVTPTVTYSIANANSTYGTQAVLGTVTLNGVLAGDVGNVTGTVGVKDSGGNVVIPTALTNAGSYTEYLTGLTGSAAGNYVIASSGNVTGTLTIAKAQLTVGTQGTVGDKVYNGTVAANVTNNGALGGTIYGSDSAGLNLTLNAAFGDKNVGTSKSVTGSYALSGAAANNYELSGPTTFTGSAAITPASLTISAVGTVQDKVYDGTTNATLSGSSLGGVIGGDQVTLGLSGAFADKNVGASKAVNGTYSVTGADAGNYVLTGGGTFTGSASITKATLTIAAVTDSKTYDGSASSSATLSAANVSGLVGGDTVNGLTQAFDSKNAGSRTLNVTGYTVNDGNSGGNYNVVTNTAAGTINKATLTIATVGSVNDKTYDGTTAATVLSNGALGGVIGADNVTLSLNGVAFTDKNAGTSKAATGSYAIAGGDAGNYQLASTAFTGSAAINKASLTIASVGTVQDKVYDGTTNATLSGSSLGGVIGSDQVTLGLSGAFADKNVGANKAVNGTYGVTGTDAGNYVLTGGGTFTGNASITKATLTIAAVTDSKTYDGSASSAAVLSAANVSGLVGGDTVSGLTQAFDSKNAGSRTLNVTGYTVNDGNSGGNYNVVTNTAAGTINKASLTIATAGTVNDKTYDGTTAATVLTNGTLGGGVTGDNLTLTLGGLTFADKNAAAGKTVTGTYTVGGTDAGNYQLASNAFTGNATINKASLTIAAVADTKTYDGTTASSGAATYSGLVGGDTISGLTQAFDSKNAGNRTLSVTGYTLNDGNSGGNYTVTANTATGVINAATLSYVANPVSRLAGDPNPALSGAVTGFVANETLAGATTGTLAWSTLADASSAAGSYAVTGSGLTANNGNYVFVQAAGNSTALTITVPSTGPTPAEIVADAGKLNPIVIEPSSTVGISGGTSGGSFWSFSDRNGGGTGTGGTGTGNGPSGGGNTGGGNSSADVFPGNARFGQWLTFSSR